MKLLNNSGTEAFREIAFKLKDDGVTEECISNIPNCLHCVQGKLTTLNYVLHAEANAITKLSKSNNSSEGATIYVTDEPCIECSKLIIQAGIKRVVYAREYRMHDGIELLNKAGIEVQQIHINN